MVANSRPLHRPKVSPRDYLDVIKIDHKSNKTVTEGMELSTLFEDYGACMLMPAVDQGPLCESFGRTDEMLEPEIGGLLIYFCRCQG